MEKNSTSDSEIFLLHLDRAIQEETIPEGLASILRGFYETYKQSLLADGISIDSYVPIFLFFLERVKEQITSPFMFAPYHEQIREPFDYYAFGVEFLRPLVDMHKSSVSGLEHADKICAQLKRGENVVLFANHQIEGDPQAISVLLEKTHPHLGEKMVFVAGERVLTDPLAIPFSMGRNLLCIYSKRYIDYPPELKMKKQLHNKHTMQRMAELLYQGGQCIYVAPSGGRDRRSSDGVVEVAPFDPQSIEMFYLIAEKAKTPTHFYPLALATYELLPPPQTVQIELGEKREAKRSGIHLAFGAEIDKEFPGSNQTDKYERRKARADYIWSLVKKDYATFKLDAS